MEEIENGSAYLVANEPHENLLVAHKPTERSVRTRIIELTTRDLEILEFILNMKFARASDVFTKFFKVTKDHKEARSNAWAKKRLLQLEQGRFLQSTYSHLNRERYYVTTLKAYHALANSNPNFEFAKPGRGFEHRTLTHDRLVLEYRIVLESRFGNVTWISDRQLRSHMGKQFGLDARYIPDGIYTLPDSEPVAFELEIAQKSRKRYRDKIKSYVDLLRARKTTVEMFKKVRFLCAKECVAKAIEDESRIYSGIIEVQTLQSKAPGFGGVL